MNLSLSLAIYLYLYIYIFTCPPFEPDVSKALKAWLLFAGAGAESGSKSPIRSGPLSLLGDAAGTATRAGAGAGAVRTGC